MTDSIVKLNNSFLMGNEIIKLNEQITFTFVQIENLLKLQLSNMKPHDCVTLVSSTLEIDNIEKNYIHFWLADTLTAVVRTIQRARFSVQQGIYIVRWILHYMSLVVAGKLSKVVLFENLRQGIILGLDNSKDYMIPLPNSTECSSFVLPTKNKKKYSGNSMIDSKSDAVKPMTALQIVTCIANALHEMFWDDFKYTVVQMAFNADPIQNNKILSTIEDYDPLYLRKNSDDELQNEYMDDKDAECCTMMEKYFFRASKNQSLNSDRLTNSLKQSMCRRCRLYVLNDKDNNYKNISSAEVNMDKK